MRQTAEELVPKRCGDALSGFGGWLLLLVIGQCLGVLRTIVAIANGVPGYQNVWTLRNGPTAIVGEVALFSAMLCLQLALSGTPGSTLLGDVFALLFGGML